jgi:hypothetical protein
MSETWIGGRFELSVDEDDDDEEPAPDVIIWLEEQSGDVLALVAVPAEEPMEAAAIVLEAAMREPDKGEPRRPSALRVESSELAEYLRERYDDIKVDVGPVDAAHEALEALYTSMGYGDDN